MNIDFKHLEKAFYSDGYKLGNSFTETNQEINLSVINEMYSAIDLLIESLSLYATQQGKKIDCKLGCEWCCHQPVFAMDYELNHLHLYVKEYFDTETKNTIREKANKKNNKLKALKNNELLNAKFPCPLLNDGACLAYEARPMACRIYLSENVNTCLKFYQHPNDKKNYPALLELPLRLGRMMNEGFKAALKTNGILAKEFRIEEKLLDF